PLRGGSGKERRERRADERGAERSDTASGHGGPFSGLTFFDRVSTNRWCAWTLSVTSPGPRSRDIHIAHNVAMTVVPIGIAIQTNGDITPPSGKLVAAHSPYVTGRRVAWRVPGCPRAGRRSLTAHRGRARSLFHTRQHYPGRP